MTLMNIYLLHFFFKNIYFLLHQADLIRLGAKYTPCIRNDAKIQEKIDALRKNETKTGCCIRNDNSGCVQSYKDQCSVSKPTKKFLFCSL